MILKPTALKLIYLPSGLLLLAAAALVKALFLKLLPVYMNHGAAIFFLTALTGVTCLAMLLPVLLASVEQDIFQICCTIHDNIFLFDSSIDKRNVIQAAVDSCIHDEILKL